MIQKLLLNLEIDSDFAFRRRQLLLKEMDTLKGKDVSCAECSGTCCTASANSMLITPLEALDLYCFLIKEERLNDASLRLCQDIVNEYRLDKDFMQGKRSFFRRTYTCPFFKEGAKGCSIAPEFKPYGCLGFNAKISGANGESGCESNVHLLQEREKTYLDLETEINWKLKERLGLGWEKRAIPLALLELHRVLSLANK